MQRDQIVALAAALLREYRGAERAWYASNPDTDKVRCVAGCTHCCYQLPLGSLVSGVLIADHLERMNPRRLEAVKEQGDLQCLLLMQHGVDGKAAEVYFSDHYQPCALLVEATSMCSVYDLRPPACSSYYVVSDPKLCRKAESTTIVGSLNNRQLQFMAMVADGALLSQALDEDRTGDIMIAPLGMMVKAGQALLHGDRTHFDQAMEVAK